MSEVTHAVAAPRVAYEVDADFVELIDPAGHKHWLTRGQNVPGWLDPERLAELVASGAVMTFGRIGYV